MLPGAQRTFGFNQVQSHPAGEPGAEPALPTLSLVPIPGMTLQSVFLSPSPFIGRDSAFEDQGCKKMPEQRDLPPGVWCRGQILLHHGI